MREPQRSARRPCVTALPLSLEMRALLTQRLAGRVQPRLAEHVADTARMTAATIELSNRRSILHNLQSSGGTAMQLRVFGRTGMQLSVLGFGCGAVGGLMVCGDPADQKRTIARAIAAGVNYFDTAVQYGDGESETNLGRVLQTLKPANVTVGTKVRLALGESGRIADAVTMSLEGSLARLRLDRVDILHLHNAITEK